MTVEWKNTQGKTLILYVHGEAENCNGEECYIVSKQPEGRFTFYVRKNAARQTV